MASLGLTKKGEQSGNKLVKMKLDDDELKEIDYHQSQHSTKVQRSRYIQIKIDPDSKLGVKKE